MPTYERRTTVDASLDVVFDFHSRVSGLDALTPTWMGLRVESVVGSDGDPDPAVLETGSEITTSVRPLSLGPRTSWTSRIVERGQGETAAYFRDEMVDGPFDRWVHTHAFVADGEVTIVADRVEYAFPGGPIGDALEALSWIGFEPMFRHRHRRTKAILENSQRAADGRSPDRVRADRT